MVFYWYFDEMTISRIKYQTEYVTTKNKRTNINERFLLPL